MKSSTHLAQDLERLDMPPTQDADEDMETILLTGELKQAILDGRTSMPNRFLVFYWLVRSCKLNNILALYRERKHRSIIRHSPILVHLL